MPAAALRAHISASGGPLRLPGIAWRLERWSAPDLGTLRDDVGEHTAVDVEIAPRGRGYTDPAWQRVIGSKVFHLLPPDIKFQTSAVRANTATVPISVRRIFGEQGEGDGEGEDVTPIEKEQLRTLLGEAFERDGACEVRLGPGDSLLIPPGWWHSAEGESVGVGVNAWFR
ncbi:hypothetical protein CcaverHIS641_0406890 [Cutaneotrichosporon cavernicola]|nr:hypothetical protein CcaverHIS641_0406890 [Cutaneotrichosporon cavernicola]